MDDKNEIIINKEENENKNMEINDVLNQNNFEINSLKYNFDYTTSFDSMNNILNATSKEKLLIQIFLMSSKINIFNKQIFLDKLYRIIELEKNNQMIYYILSKMINYIKTGRISVYTINTNLFYFTDFLSNNENYFYAYKFFTDLQNLNDNVSIDKKTLKEINEFIQSKIDYFKKYFTDIISSKEYDDYYNIINNILNQNVQPEINEEKDNKIYEEKEYVYLINKTWLINAKNFFDHYIFGRDTQMTIDFFNDAFDMKNVLSVFVSEDKLNKPIQGKTYFPFPGPINNFPMSDWKDILYDPIDEEENTLIKKYLILKKDFFWINHKDWMTLKQAFNCTNEIKRKKKETEMIQLSAFIFDSNMRKYKNESIKFMKKKVIQISKNKTLKDFETKIKRCLDYEIDMIKGDKNENKKNDEKIVYLYKIKKNNKDIIIEMILSFINNIQTYESIFLKEIIFSNEDKEKSIESILKEYNPRTEILVIEIYDPKDNNRFLKSINEYNCSICNKKIEDIKNSKDICKLCSMYLFCSKECAEIIKNNDEQNIIKMNHSLLHKYLSELIIKPFKIKEFISINFYEKIFTKENIGKSKGLLGLFNLGNTCYINCSIQCLSNTKDLTKYFLLNYYQNDINLQTTFGSNGLLVKSYSDLINLMWLSKFKKINPHFFRIAFCVSTNKFMNNRQQDAMEFISILLNFLHEDLNRIKQKPYLMIEEQKENESDILASQRIYNYNLKRDNSIIIDLFNGQFQNTIKCTTCFKEYKKYEPFNNISLPIPEEHNHYIIKFFTTLKCKYITININSETTFEDLITNASKYLSKNILNSIEEAKKLNPSNEYYKVLLKQNIDIVKLDKNKIINIIYSQPDDENEIQKNYKKKLKSYINNEEEIVLYEREIIPEYLQNIYVYPITTDPNDDNNINFLSYPIVFSVKHNLTLENLEKLISEKLSHIIIDDKNIKNCHIIDLHILHSNKNMNTGFLKLIKAYKKCPFCNNDYGEKKYCPLYFYFNRNDIVSKLFKYSKYSEPLILLARSSYYDINKEVYPGYNFEENNILNKYKNIYDSLNQFGRPELLGEDNLWDCPKCSTKRKISKWMKIFRAPNYLIIQLKRFKKKSNSFFNFLESDKNETFVSFPMKNLDLSNYIDGPERDKCIYNLYAVINHTSIFGVNHFTAFCRYNKKWIEYDDDKINYDIKNPVTKEAYILFYIKKNIDENL